MGKIDWSKAPDDATHAAKVDGANKVCWYKDIDETGYCYMYSFGVAISQWSDGDDPKPRHAPLEPRPQFRNSEHQDHKEGEGVKWEPGVGLPPVRKEPYKVYIDGREEWIDVLAHHDGKAVVAFHNSDGTYSYTSMRPHEFPKSRRDNVIEAAMADIEQDWYAQPVATISEYVENAVAQLYDKGRLKLPEDDQ